MEEIEAREPFITKKMGSRITEVIEKIMPTKKGGSRKKAAAPKRGAQRKRHDRYRSYCRTDNANN